MAEKLAAAGGDGGRRDLAALPLRRPQGADARARGSTRWARRRRWRCSPGCIGWRASPRTSRSRSVCSRASRQLRARTARGSRSSTPMATSGSSTTRTGCAATSSTRTPTRCWRCATTGRRRARVEARHWLEGGLTTLREKGTAVPPSGDLELVQPARPRRACELPPVPCPAAAGADAPHRAMPWFARFADQLADDFQWSEVAPWMHGPAKPRAGGTPGVTPRPAPVPGPSPSTGSRRHALLIG